MTTRREQIDGLRATWNEIESPILRQELVDESALFFLLGAVDIEVVAIVFDWAREEGLIAPEVYSHDYPVEDWNAVVA